MAWLWLLAMAEWLWLGLVLVKWLGYWLRLLAWLRLRAFAWLLLLAWPKLGCFSSAIAVSGLKGLCCVLAGALVYSDVRL